MGVKIENGGKIVQTARLVGQTFDAYGGMMVRGMNNLAEGLKKGGCAERCLLEEMKIVTACYGCGKIGVYEYEAPDQCDCGTRAPLAGVSVTVCVWTGKPSRGENGSGDVLDGAKS